jgi:hypothetical protein
MFKATAGIFCDRRSSLPRSLVGPTNFAGCNISEGREQRPSQVLLPIRLVLDCITHPAKCPKCVFIEATLDQFSLVVDGRRRGFCDTFGCAGKARRILLRARQLETGEIQYEWMGLQPQKAAVVGKGCRSDGGGAAKGVGDRLTIGASHGED